MSPRRPAIPIRKLAPAVLCALLIVFSLARFATRSVYAAIEEFETYTGPASDLYSWYTAGELWNAGHSPYDYEAFQQRIQQLSHNRYQLDGYYYPPQATWAFSLLARLPLRSAFYLQLAFNLALLAASLAMLAAMLAWQRRIGWFEVALLAVLLNTAFARSNIHYAQTSLAIAFLLFATFLLVHHRRNTLAGVALGLLSFKPTSLPIFLLYYLYRRNYRLVAACLLTGAAVTVLPVWLSGRPLFATLWAWLDAMRFASSTNSINDPSPFHSGSAEMLNLAPLVYRIANSAAWPAQLLAWGVLLALGILIFRRIRRAPGELNDLALVSMLTLWYVYHRTYDTFLLYPALLILYQAALEARPARPTWLRWAPAALLVLILGAFALPGDLAARASDRFPQLLDLYPWRVVAPYQVWASLALFAAVWYLTRPAQVTQTVPAPTLEPAPTASPNE